MHYIYCIKLKRSEEEFWHRSNLVKICSVLDIYVEEQEIQQQVAAGENPFPETAIPIDEIPYF